MIVGGGRGLSDENRSKPIILHNSNHTHIITRKHRKRTRVIQRRFVYVFMWKTSTPRDLHVARFTIDMHIKRHKRRINYCPRKYKSWLLRRRRMSAGNGLLQLARGGSGTIDFLTTLYDGSGSERAERETPAAAVVVAAKGPRRRRSTRVRRYNRTR